MMSVMDNIKYQLIDQIYKIMPNRQYEYTYVMVQSDVHNYVADLLQIPVYEVVIEQVKTNCLKHVRDRVKSNVN